MKHDTFKEHMENIQGSEIEKGELGLTKSVKMYLFKAHLKVQELKTQCQYTYIHRVQFPSYRNM